MAHFVEAESPSYWRGDIQALRAIAVLAVVGFHVGLPVSSGFLGVDIFFVISGYVISGVLSRQYLKFGKINFLGFISRRFSRLFPAFIAATSVTVGLSVFILSPGGPLEAASFTAAASLVGLANVAISTSSINYFAEAAAANPLLHLWSLSVENQFYLVFPLLLVLAIRVLGPRLGMVKSIVWAVAFVVVLSFIGFGWVTAGGLGQHLFGYYSPVVRAWEFGLGSIAYFSKWRVTSFAARAFRLLALCALLITFLLPKDAVGQEVLTLISTLSVFVVLSIKKPDAGFDKFYLARPLQAIGKWSYSIYLWHWPLVVFTRYLWPTETLAVVLVGLSSIPIGAVSYRVFELPDSRPKRFSRSGSVAILVTSATILFLVSVGINSASRYVWEAQYAAGQHLPKLRGTVGWLSQYELLRDDYFPCENEVVNELAMDWDGVKRCRQSAEGTPVDLVLLGDSHAEHLFEGFAESLPRRNVAYWSGSEVPTLEDSTMAALIREIAADSQIRDVVVSASWYGRGVNPGDLKTSLSQLAQGGRQVYLLDDVPDFPFEPRECAFGKSYFMSVGDCEILLDEFASQYSEFGPSLEAVSASIPGVTLLNSSAFFCDEASCDMRHGDTMLYRDNNHLNELGSRFLAQRLLELAPELHTASGGASTLR